MARLRIDCFLAGLLIAVGLALLLGAAGSSWEVPAIFLALSLIDVLVTVAGLLVAAMTGVACALLVADAHGDSSAARAWQDSGTEMAVHVHGTAGEAAPVGGGGEARYTVRPQDESLRRILLAHRFVVPGQSLRDVCSAAPPRADAVAAGEIDGVQSGTELLLAEQQLVADRRRARVAATSDTARDCSPPPIAGELKEIGRRGQRSTKRRVSRSLLVANAGVWWQDPHRCLGDARRALAGACEADVIVLTERSSRDGNPAHRDVTPEPATTAQPGCRGPPAGASQRQVASEPARGAGSFREDVQSRANAPADPAVVDNLGDNVPVGAAELEVVEAYLDDVLRDLLATVAADRDHRES